VTAHTFHPDSHEHGLADDCPRCTEIAADPFLYMDDRNLALLHDRTMAWMRDDEFPRSIAEKAAMRVMEQTLIRVRHLRRLGFLEATA